MWTRRDVLRFSVSAPLATLAWPANLRAAPQAATGRVVNDTHSKLNGTRVNQVHRPQSVEAVQQIIDRAARRGEAVSASGARHAMGGQQFVKGGTLIDLRGLDQVHELDREAQTVEVGAGIQWPKLMSDLAAMQSGSAEQLGIIQKQTGADEMTIGGALAANIHSRSLTKPPIVDDVVSFVLVDANGDEHVCSREENEQLFRLAIGGYGLFGVIARVKLRLMPRVKLRRVVDVVDADQIIPTFQKRINDGCLYGDFQYMTDPESDGFLTHGILSCYKPVSGETPVSGERAGLSEEQWRELIYLGHTDRAKAYELYEQHYRQTEGQVYWSDQQQQSTYDPRYHALVDQRMNASEPATEMITEIFVPRDALADFLRSAADLLRDSPAPVVYGTVRLIERDTETFLAWARQRYACIIFNLHCRHTDEDLAKAREVFRSLIDLGIRYEGSYYLTYHRWARREQIEQCYPQFVDFLKQKRRYDPHERFQSQWYRHYKEMFANELS